MIRSPRLRSPMNRPKRSTIKGVPFVPPSPGWPHQFLSEARRLTAAGVTGTIQHIGSTAVPGLAAKPVIDIQLVIADEQWDPRPLTAAGYRWIRGFTRSSRYYERPAEGTTYLIRVRDPSDPNVRRCLLFRDYLIAHPTEAAAYRALKSDLAWRYPRRPARYRAGKAAWLVAANERAEQWAATTGWTRTSTGSDCGDG